MILNMGKREELSEHRDKMTHDVWEDEGGENGG